MADFRHFGGIGIGSRKEPFLGGKPIPPAYWGSEEPEQHLMWCQTLTQNRDE